MWKSRLTTLVILSRRHVSACRSSEVVSPGACAGPVFSGFVIDEAGACGAVARTALRRVMHIISISLCATAMPSKGGDMESTRTGELYVRPRKMHHAPAGGGSFPFDFAQGQGDRVFQGFDTGGLSCPSDTTFTNPFQVSLARQCPSPPATPLPGPRRWATPPAAP